MRRGFTLVEVLVAFVLIVLVANAVGGIVATQSRVARWIQDEAEALEVGRTVRVVLEGELRHGTSDRDWNAPARDTLSLRAFRGVGAVCGPGTRTDQLVVRYRGLRQANPAKDSVLILFEDGRWDTRAVARVDAWSGACPASPTSARSEQWTFDGPVAGGVFLRLYERGSYHFADGAFRYRSGDAGRQPLTVERLDHRSSRLDASSGGVDVQLRFRSDGSRGSSGPAPGEWRIWSVR